MKKNNENVLKSMWTVLCMILGKVKDLFPDTVHEAWQAGCKIISTIAHVGEMAALLLSAIIIAVIALPFGALCWIFIVFSNKAQETIDAHHRTKDAEHQVLEINRPKVQEIIEANTPRTPQLENKTALRRDSDSQSVGVDTESAYATI